MVIYAFTCVGDHGQFSFLPPNALCCSEQPSKRRKVDPVADAIIENPAVDYNAVDFQQDFGAPTRKH